MKYLLQWIKRELNPEKHISSVSTNSEYFYVHNVKIRISDHLGKNDNDLQVIIVKNLLGKNKQYLLKEGDYPTLITIPDVKTLKIVLTTFLFHFNNINVKQAIKVKTEQDAQTSIERLKQNAAIAVTKLNNGEELTSQDNSFLGSYLIDNLPQYKVFTPEFRRYIRNLFKSGASLEEFINIINTEFRNNESSWKFNNVEVWKLKVNPYIAEKYIENSVICNEIAKTINMDHPDNEYRNHALAYIKIISLPPEKRKKENNALAAHLGYMLGIDTHNVYKKCTANQRKIYRECILEHNIPYNIAVELFNKVMYENKNKGGVKPATANLKEIIDRFITLYKNGILLYPNEEEFKTYKLSDEETEDNRQSESSESTIKQTEN